MENDVAAWPALGTIWRGQVFGQAGGFVPGGAASHWEVNVSASLRDRHDRPNLSILGTAVELAVDAVLGKLEGFQ